MTVWLSVFVNTKLKSTNITYLTHIIYDDSIPTKQPNLDLLILLLTAILGPIANLIPTMQYFQLYGTQLQQVKLAQTVTIDLEKKDVIYI